MGDNLRFNSKVLGFLTVLLVIAVVVSAVNAVDLTDNFSNENFEIKIPSGCDFSQNSTSSINFGDVALSMVIYANNADNAKDVNSITFLKDSSSDKKAVSDFMKDLKKDNEIVEETDKYTVVKTQNLGISNGSSSDMNWSFDDALSLANDIFSDDGINFSADGSNLSLSGNGLQISDADGTNVSISSSGVHVSDGENSSNNADISFNENMSADFMEGDYVVCIENQNSNQLILLSGNNLEFLKAMADTASFKN